MSVLDKGEHGIEYTRAECETLYKERCSTEYELKCTTGGYTGCTVLHQRVANTARSDAV